MSLRMVTSALALLLFAGAALAQAQNWQTGLPPAATPVMARIAQFHNELLLIVTAVFLLVAVLLMTVIVRFNHRRNPEPSTTQHNAALEAAWIIIPVAILVLIALPSYGLLTYEAESPQPDVTIQATGHQGHWTYAYSHEDGLQFDSSALSEAAAKERGEPRLLGADNPLVVPVNKTVEVMTTGADVIYSWAVPAFGVKLDALPGRLNHTWFKATKTGTYYGPCAELCGAGQAFLPIEVKVVSARDYVLWLAAAKEKYAGDGPQRVAANF
jgi:cytochrome c oxidase subunit II